MSKIKIRNGLEQHGHLVIRSPLRPCTRSCRATADRQGHAEETQRFVHRGRRPERLGRMHGRASPDSDAPGSIVSRKGGATLHQRLILRGPRLQPIAIGDLVRTDRPIGLDCTRTHRTSAM